MSNMSRTTSYVLTHFFAPVCNFPAYKNNAIFPFIWSKIFCWIQIDNVTVLGKTKLEYVIFAVRNSALENQDAL